MSLVSENEPTPPQIVIRPPSTTRAPGRTVTIRSVSYPLILPTLRDPRLHVAAVIVSIHILGQVGLHFAVSVPQILAAILTCAIIEVSLTFHQTRSFVWPASAMLTGSGVALILRVGTPPDQPWNTDAWYLFAAIAGLSLLTKYVIHYRGSHVFNPSNVGLVAAFVVLGSTRVEPLDFWWGPLDIWLITAYALIIVGGLLITRRLRLLAVAATYWITLAIGTGILAGSGHCMTADWAFEPVCGVDYWRVIVTSPEVLIFLFFMLTDPKTIPAGQVGRITFAILVGVVSTLLMAPQTTEFGTKVGLLGGLVIVCAARPFLDRFLPEPRSAADDVRRFAGDLLFGRGPAVAPGRRAAGVGTFALVVLLVSGGIVAAGTPARGLVVAATTRMLGDVPHQVDPATFPDISVDVPAWADVDGGSIAQEILVALAEDLELENQALLQGDESILAASDHGDRLADMQSRLRDATASGRTAIGHYQFDAVHVVVIAPFGVQSGGSLGFESQGTVTTETYDRDGTLLDRQTAPFALTFAMRRPTGDRWLIVGVFPPGVNEAG